MPFRLRTHVPSVQCAHSSAGICWVSFGPAATKAILVGVNGLIPFFGWLLLAMP